MSEYELEKYGVCSVPQFLSRSEIREYLRQSHSNEWYNHKSTVSGKASSLHFLPTQYKSYDRVALMKMEPHAIQDWHVDGTRSCVVIHPLSENYASGMTEHGEYAGPVLLDVKRRHAVFNNEYTRICLQIGFNEGAVETWRSLKL